MAYIPPSFDNIVIGEEALPVYTPPTYNNIIIAETLGIGRYAIVSYNNHMVTISDTLLGTGLKPYVWYEGVLKVRENAEGIPFIFKNGVPCTLPEEDYLII